MAGRVWPLRFRFSGSGGAPPERRPFWGFLWNGPRTGQSAVGRRKGWDNAPTVIGEMAASKLQQLALEPAPPHFYSPQRTDRPRETCPGLALAGDRGVSRVWRSLVSASTAACSDRRMCMALMAMV